MTDSLVNTFSHEPFSNKAEFPFNSLRIRLISCCYSACIISFSRD